MPKNILVIDDEEPLRRMLISCLEKEGYRVAIAPSAAEANFLIKQETFSLIILDLLLPDTTGYDFLMAVKKSHPQIPILVLTGMDYEEDILQGALKAGANGYVSKLDSIENLMSAVRRILKNGRASSVTA